VERTKMLAHVIDVSSTGRDPVEDFLTITRELKLYKEELLAKPQIVAASKMDALDEPGRVEQLRNFCGERGLEMFEISAVTGLGIKEFVNAVGAKLAAIRGASEAVVTTS
jgi:GTP-binding protein